MTSNPEVVPVQKSASRRCIDLLEARFWPNRINSCRSLDTKNTVNVAHHELTFQAHVDRFNPSLHSQMWWILSRVKPDQASSLSLPEHKHTLPDSRQGTSGTYSGFLSTQIGSWTKSVFAHSKTSAEAYRKSVKCVISLLFLFSGSSCRVVRPTLARGRQVNPSIDKFGCAGVTYLTRAIEQALVILCIILSTYLFAQDHYEL